MQVEVTKWNLRKFNWHVKRVVKYIFSYLNGIGLTLSTYVYTNVGTRYTEMPAFGGEQKCCILMADRWMTGRLSGCECIEAARKMRNGRRGVDEIVLPSDL